MTFGDRIRKLREERGLTLREVGDAVGRTHVSVLNWEQNDKGTTLRIAVMLADYYGVSLDWLCGRSKRLEKEPRDG